VSERLVRLCDCNACRTELGDMPPVSTPDHVGAYCSRFCADHAGKELRIAQVEHRDAG
jgi:hypothetical protein